MDDLFTFLFVLLFIILPILERVLKGGKGKSQTPPGRRPVQRRPMPQSLPPGRTPTTRPATTTTSTTTPTARTEETQKDATDLIPAELWAILTGQQPPPRPKPEPPARPPVREAEPEEAASLEVLRAETTEADEATQYAELRRRRQRATEVARRVEHTPPAIVSLETEPLPESRRHEAFHKRMDALTAADQKARPAPAARPADLLGLDSKKRSELQRAILLQEVLGTPKGLLE